MLILVNKYGLSHVCASQEFQNIDIEMSAEPFNFPFLDIYLTYYDSLSIDFYYRGAKDRTIKFENLFEYLLSTALNRQELKIFHSWFNFDVFYRVVNIFIKNILSKRTRKPSILL